MNLLNQLAVLCDLRDRGRNAGALDKIKIAEEIVEAIVPLFVELTSRILELEDILETGFYDSPKKTDFEHQKLLIARFRARRKS